MHEKMASITPRSKESALKRAKAIVPEKPRWGSLAEEELSRRRKGDPAKLSIAMRLGAQTTMTLRWVAQQLQMGNVTHLNNRLYRERREKLPD